VSNYFAIGTVTAALELILQNPVQTAVNGAKVRSDRPAGPAFTPITGLNIYLYSVVPNAAWRNNDLPTRSGGVLIHQPQAAVDLNYLLTGYGDDRNLEPQLIIAAAIATLEAQPVITRPVIDAVFQAANLAVSPVHPELKNTNLALQVESVRLCPIELSTEELSKLWTVFESPYSVSVAYRAGVVLLDDGAVAPPPTLPVLVPPGISVSPAETPVIDRVVSAAGATQLIRSTDTILIMGRHLAGADTLVRIAGVDVAPDRASDRIVRLDLTAVPAGTLSPGVQTVQVIQRIPFGSPAIPHSGVASNLATFLLHPVVTAVAKVGPSVASGAAFDVTLRLTLDLPVGPEQNVMALVSDPTSRQVTGMFRGPRRQTATATPSIPVHLPAGTYAIQALIDGAESPPSAAASVVIP
jgi:hypothetical protein